MNNINYRLICCSDRKVSAVVVGVLKSILINYIQMNYNWCE